MKLQEELEAAVKQLDAEKAEHAKTREALAAAQKATTDATASLGAEQKAHVETKAALEAEKAAQAKTTAALESEKAAHAETTKQRDNCLKALANPAFAAAAIQGAKQPVADSPVSGGTAPKSRAELEKEYAAIPPEDGKTREEFRNAHRKELGL